MNNQEIEQLALESSGDWELLVSPDATVLYCSPSSFRVIGIPSDVVRHDLRAVEAIIEPEDLAMLRTHCRDAVAGMESGECEFRIMRGGEVRWIHHLCWPVHDAEGRYIGQRSSNRDVTKYHLRVEAREREAEVHRFLFNVALDLASQPQHHLETGVIRLFAQLGERTGAERILLIQPTRDATIFSITHRWTAPDFIQEQDKQILNYNISLTPWFEQQLRLGRTVAAGGIEDIPPEGQQDFVQMQRVGNKSVVLVPLRMLDGTMAALIAVSRSKPKRWSADDVQFLTSAGEVLPGILSRMQLEEERREAETRLQFAIEGGGEGMWDWDLRTGSLWFSERYSDLLGYKPGELDPSIQTWEDGLHPEDRDAALAILRRSLEDPAAEYRSEFRMRAKDGSWKWILSRGIVVQYGDDSTPVRMIGTHLDITSRKQQEMDILRSRDEVLRSRDEVLRSRDEVLRSRDEMLRSRDELRRAYDELERVSMMKDEFLATMSHELRTPLTSILGLTEVLLLMPEPRLSDKQRHFVEIIENSGRHLLDLINDMLDVAKIEAGRLDLDLQRTQLLEVCEIAQRLVRVSAAQKHQHFDIIAPDGDLSIVADSRRLTQIIVNLLSNAIKYTPDRGSILLTVSKAPQPGHICISVRDTGIGIAAADLPKLFHPFVQLETGLSRQSSGTGLGLVLVRRMVELHGGTVHVESTPGEGSTFIVILPIEGWRAAEHHDANSHDALLPSSGSRDVRAPHDHPLDMADAGAPFDPREVSADVRAPHDRPLDSAHVREPSHPFAASVDVHAEQDHLGDSTGILEPFHSATEVVDTPRIEILLVDDHDVNREVLSDRLRMMGFDVREASGAIEALQLIDERMPGLVITDIQMPGMDGLQLIAALRAHDHGTAIPVIALTALVMAGDRERCLEAGASAYLGKPVDMRTLVATITRLTRPPD